MNNKLKYFLLVLPFLLFSVCLKGQNVVQELKKVRNAYTSAKNLSFDVEVYSYATKVDKTPELVSKGYMKKSNDRYYTNFDNHEMMIKGEKALLVDNTSKSMKYYEYNINKRSPKDMGTDLNIDSLMLSSDSVVIRGVKNGEKHFTSFSKKGYVKQTEIYVDEKTNFVKHILYYYVTATDEYEMEVDRVEIFYKNIATKIVDENFFSFDKYFKKGKSNYFSVGKYQGYKVNYYTAKS